MGGIVQEAALFITLYGGVFFLAALLCGLAVTALFDVPRGMYAGLGLLLLASLAILLYSLVGLGSGAEDLGILVVALVYCNLLGVLGLGVGTGIVGGVRVLLASTRGKRARVADRTSRSLVVYGVALAGLFLISILLWPLLSAEGGA